MSTQFDQIADKVLAGTPASEADALAVLQAPDFELMSIVAAAGRLRREHFGNTVKVNYLVNLKSGLCPENCNYCSQARGSEADILKYSYLSKDDAIAQAGAGLKGGASRVCMVSSGRGPSNKDIDKVVEMTEAIKDEYEGVEVCACLGLLKDGQAERLKAAGVDAYNHNINTAESNHDNIVQTHTYADRVDTIGKAKSAGLSPCSGLIAGLGESDEQLVEALFALKALESDSIPVNFLMPFDGTPYENTWELSPQRCLKILAMARFVCPDKEIRIAGGREMHLRSLQGQALHVANSIFLGDYLTSTGQDARDDLEMIRDNGFVILGQENAFNDGTFDEVFNAPRGGHAHAAATTTPCGSSAGSACGDGCGGCTALNPEAKAAEAAEAVDPHKPVIRRRGAGTEVPANA
ncbi:biotin synthase [Nocardioides phosphati]|uniref:Biotin synthase n=1 Tax=Nocardioides phosphati TaxID=1867775 RepID=A0ABQ2N7Y0_9ACTN|nr:biotin synthase BioB [Nocardioides phosphati]GGO87782.1 biotin synthase [Nocardioides phosphati]